MISVQNLMKNPITIAKSSTLSDAIKKLLYYDISRLIVTDEGKAIGIFSEKDIGYHLFTDKTSRGLEQIPVREILKDIVFIEGSAAVKKCAEIMIDKKIGSLVIGSSTMLDGILTKTDIIKFFQENYIGENKVVDIKNPGYISISAESPLSEAIQKMIANKVSRIIVKNQKNEPIGIISYRDFFRISLQLGSGEDVTEAAVLSGSIRTGFLSESGFGGVSLVRDVMTHNIISINPDEDLAMACKVMLDNHVNGLFVKDEEGRMGIVSKTDMVQMLALKE